MIKMLFSNCKTFFINYIKTIFEKETKKNNKRLFNMKAVIYFNYFSEKLSFISGISVSPDIISGVDCLQCVYNFLLSRICSTEHLNESTQIKLIYTR